MKKKSLLHNKWIIGFLILPFFEPSGVEEMAVYLGGMWSYLNLIFSLMKYLVFLILVFHLVQELNRPTFVFLIVGLYEAYIMGVSWLHGNLTVSGLSTAINVIGAALLFDYYLRGPSAYQCIEITSKILAILIILNLVSIIMYPNGMYIDKRLWTDNFLFGYKNRHIYMFLPYLMIKTIEQYKKYAKLRAEFYIMTAVIVVSSILCKSITTTLAVSFYALMTILFQHNNFHKLLSIWRVYIISIISSVLFIVMGVQNYFGDFFSNVLGKDTSFSARVLIWESATKSFSEHPVFGNGLISYDNLFLNWVVSQMHNMYLDVLVVGGIVLFIIFSVMVYHISKKHQQISLDPIYNMTLFIYVGFFILFITEGKRDLTSFVICMISTYYMPEIIERYSVHVTRNKIIRFKW